MLGLMLQRNDKPRKRFQALRHLNTTWGCPQPDNFEDNGCVLSDLRLFTANFCSIRLAIMARVHRPKSKPYWRGSLPLTQANTRFFWRGVNKRGRPVAGRERKAFNPLPGLEATASHL